MPDSHKEKENSLPKTVEDLLVYLKDRLYWHESYLTPELLADIANKFGLTEGMPVFDVRVVGDEEGRSSMDFYTCAGPREAVMAFAAHERRGPGSVKDTISAYEKPLKLDDRAREWIRTLSNRLQVIQDTQRHLDRDQYPRPVPQYSFGYRPGDTIDKSSDLNILRKWNKEVKTLVEVGPILKIEPDGTHLCPHCQKMISTPDLASEDRYGRLL